MHAGNVAIIGGGRWARVLAGVLLEIMPPGAQLTLCSPSAPGRWTEWLESQTEQTQVSCLLSDDITSVLRDTTISHVLIARAAKDHADTARGALDAGKKVFVEKPFATDLLTAKALAEYSEDCVTGLVFRYASNLRRFAKACTAKGEIVSTLIDWGDAASEMRHGERKQHDASLNVAWDVFPHIWSILRLFVPEGAIRLLDAGWIDYGQGIKANLEIDRTQIKVAMTRRAERRTRHVIVTGADWGAEIDFATEPGNATMNGTPADVATDFASPLARELSAFLGVSDAQVDPLCLLPNAFEALTISSEISDQLGTFPH